MTDRRGVAYFYDLCPGTYYISNLAPIEVDGQSLVWETAAITIKGPEAGGQDQLSTTQVFLANVPPRKKLKNAFASKKVTGASASAVDAVGGKPVGQ